MKRLKLHAAEDSFEACIIERIGKDPFQRERDFNSMIKPNEADFVPILMRQIQIIIKSNEKTTG